MITGQFRTVIAAMLLLSIAVGLFVPRSSGLSNQRSPRALGEELLRAAEARDWNLARRLLEEGADPNITSFAPAAPLPPQDWRGKFALERPSPLSQAASQGNVDAVKLLLRYKARVDIRAPADPGPLLMAVTAKQVAAARVLLAAGADPHVRAADNHDAIDMARYSGNQDLIRLLEDAGSVPIYKRTVPMASGHRPDLHAEARVAPGTEGAYPSRRLLWVSRDALLVLHQPSGDLRRFDLVDVRSGAVTPLPGLSRKWARQKLFDPDMLAVSTDGKWLLGYGGDDGHETWLATEIRGDREQTWPRPSAKPPAMGVDPRYPFAWMDGHRWVELRDGYEPLRACIRTLGSAAVTEIPVVQPGSMAPNPMVHFQFLTPKEGLLYGMAGLENSGGVLRGESTWVSWIVRVVPDPTGWRMPQREIRFKQSEVPGDVHRCAVSPRGDRIAWLQHFSTSEASAIVLTDRDGKSPQVLFEHLYPIQNYREGRAASPWVRFLEWTPRGDAVIFWRGEDGKHGLCLVPVPSR